MDEKIREVSKPKLFFYFLSMILGVLIIIASWKYGFGTSKRPGPGMYPFLVGLIIILPFSAALFILGVKSKKSEPQFDKSSFKTFSLMVISFILWVVTLPVLGYVVATFGFNFAFCKLMNLEGWIKPIIMSICTALFVYLLFDVWLYIDLPRGLLGR